MGAAGNQGAQHQQPGGGGSNGPNLVQPPGSPPRQLQQHHTGATSGTTTNGGYGGQQQQQLQPSFNPAELYFNFPPFYGMEGAALYTDGSLDLANGNSYAEVI